jgi:hypothetical protein
MEIILEGGPFNGAEWTIGDTVRQLTVNDELVYKIADTVFRKNRQVFKFDEKASSKRQSRENDRARMDAQKARTAAEIGSHPDPDGGRGSGKAY